MLRACRWSDHDQQAGGQRINEEAEVGVEAGSGRSQSQSLDITPAAAMPDVGQGAEGDDHRHSHEATTATRRSGATPGHPAAEQTGDGEAGQRSSGISG